MTMTMTMTRTTARKVTGVDNTQYPIHHQGIVDDDVGDIDKDNDDNSSDGGDGDSLHMQPITKRAFNDNNYDDDDNGYDGDIVDDDNDHMQSITEQCPPALLLSGVRLQLRGGCTTHGSRSTKMPSFTSFPSGIFHK